MLIIRAVRNYGRIFQGEMFSSSLMGRPMQISFAKVF